MTILITKCFSSSVDQSAKEERMESNVKPSSLGTRVRAPLIGNKDTKASQGKHHGMEHWRELH